MGKLKITVLAAAVVTALTAFPASAHKAGDFIVRIGGAKAVPTGGATCFNGPTADTLGSCVRPNAQNDTQVGLTLGYMITDNFGLQLLGSTPFNHYITAEVDGTSLGRVARAKHLPPTLTANWYFNAAGKFNPFIGAGVNYTHFFNENTTGALDALGIHQINLEDSWGPAATFGFDWNFDHGIMLGVQAYYAKMSTKAHIGSGVGNSDVNIDPWVYFAGFGKKF